jgi:hypothetical protein
MADVPANIAELWWRLGDGTTTGHDETDCISSIGKMRFQFLGFFVVF